VAGADVAEVDSRRIMAGRQRSFDSKMMGIIGA